MNKLTFTVEWEDNERVYYDLEHAGYDRGSVKLSLKQYIMETLVSNIEYDDIAVEVNFNE